ncbi:uncharacterized protein LOC110233248 [Exaiptasia diaphana]|uniref:Uncharacterized protein n=1 Tax=Exaiptasia diaphana TaxID=2652724 RepID=A0A913WU60_EXADI|nr:uncharacterized protein LOC110233248 [Exaiptasia diaphana]
MSVRVTAALLLFVAICYVEFPRSSAYSWIQYPNPEIKISYPNTKSVTMRWEWKLSKNSQKTEFLSQIEIKRYVKGNKDATEKTIATYFAINDNTDVDHSLFTLSVQKGAAGGSNGSAAFTIKDVTNQGQNKDGTQVDVLKGIYIYSCIISLANIITNPGPKSTTLTVYRSQPVTTAPDSQNNSTNPPVTTAPDGQNNSTNPPATTVPDSQNNSTNPQVTTAPDSQNNSTNPPVTTALDGQNNSTSPIVNASPPSASWTLRCGILLLMTIMSV